MPTFASTVTCVSHLIALFLLVLEVQASSAYAQDQVITKSPGGDKQVIIGRGPHGTRAIYVWSGGKLDATQGVPFPGEISVSWVNNDIAQVGGACGPGCNANFLVSPSHVAGPYPYILAMDAKSGLFAASNGTSIFVQTLARSKYTLVRRRVPAWCAALTCKFKVSFIGNVFVLASGNRKLTLLQEPAPVGR